MSPVQVEGSELKKIRTNSRVYQRYYLLDTGLQALCWEPSKKESDKARICLASIREVRDRNLLPDLTVLAALSTRSEASPAVSELQVRTGRNTETFRTSGVYEQVSEDCAFSIIYGEMYESLDLVANSAEVAIIWVTGLRYDTEEEEEEERPVGAHICLMIFRKFGLLILTFFF